MARYERIKVDKSTGEALDYYTKKFWKCYREDFFNVLKVIENQQLKIFIYICEKVSPSSNEFRGTYTEISKAVKVSQTTIAKTLQQLQEKDFIRKVHNGVWMVNPNSFMQGDDSRRAKLLDDYYSKSRSIDK